MGMLSNVGDASRARASVSVVIVSYNSGRWLPGCLESLIDGSILEVIVVDNGSTDGSADIVADSWPDVRLVRNTANVGFAAAVNQGSVLAAGRYLLMVNPDGYVQPGAVDELMRFIESDGNHVIVGGRTITTTGDLDPRSCWAAPTLWGLFCSAIVLSTATRGHWLFDPEAMGRYGRDEPRTVDIVSGCLLMIAIADWRRLGGFDERYFVYGEDADLCLRATALTGRRCAITPDAVMTHVGGASSATTADKHELVLRGRITVVRRHIRGRRGAVGARLIVIGVGVRAVLEGAGLGRDTNWSQVWRRRRRWRDGYDITGATTHDVLSSAHSGGGAS